MVLLVKRMALCTLGVPLKVWFPLTVCLPFPSNTLQASYLPLNCSKLQSLPPLKLVPTASYCLPGSQHHLGNVPLGLSDLPPNVAQPRKRRYVLSFQASSHCNRHKNDFNCKLLPKTKGKQPKIKKMAMVPHDSSQTTLTGGSGEWQSLHCASSNLPPSAAWYDI